MIKKIMKPKRIKKITKQNNQKVKIEKIPYTEEERIEKLKQDRITIAKRYEEMRLYDEAIQYYKKLGMSKDVERVQQIKRDIYIGKAQEFEKLGKYEDAIRLYENLKMNDKVDRLKRELEERSDQQSSLQIPTTTQNTNIPSEPDSVSDPDHNLIKKGPIDVGHNEGAKNYIQSKEKDINIRSPPTKLEKFVEPVQSKLDTDKKSPQIRDTGRTFRICPYCGEELDLPRKPNFCPYCKESFV